MDGKMNALMPNGEKQVTFEVLLDDMERVGSVPSEKNKNEDWVKRYENWTYMLQKSYEEALRKEKLDEIFAFNRKLGKIAKLIGGFALLQGNVYLYSMGAFVGAFHTMAGMLPERNKEQTFNIRMAEEYCIHDKYGNMVKYGKFINTELTYPEEGFERKVYE